MPVNLDVIRSGLVIPTKITETLNKGEEGKLTVPLSSKEDVIVHISTPCNCTTTESTVNLKGDYNLDVTMSSFNGTSRTKSIVFKVFTPLGELVNKYTCTLELTYI